MHTNDCIGEKILDTGSAQRDKIVSCQASKHLSCDPA
jgi:hypothetical protein